MTDKQYLPATCQYCLADTNHTRVAWEQPATKRCPVCGAAYTGPRRDAEYRLLVEHGWAARWLSTRNVS